MAESIVNFRVDEDLKKAFEMVAKNEDLTSSQMLRGFMRWKVEQYMKKDAQKSLLSPQIKPSNTKAKAKEEKKSIIPDAWRKK